MTTVITPEVILNSLIEGNTRVLDGFFSLSEKLLDQARQLSPHNRAEFVVNFLQTTQEVTKDYFETLRRGCDEFRGLSAEPPPALEVVASDRDLASPQLRQVFDDPPAATQGSRTDGVRALLAKQTGHAVANLTKDKRLDDIGIDSLALVGIVEQLARQHGFGAEEATGFLHAKTVGDLEAGLRDLHSTADQTAAADRTAPTPVPAAPKLAVASPAESWLERLIRILAERTGFPAAAIAPETALEDLGVDSLARLSLFEELAREFPETLTASTALIDARTVRDVVEALPVPPAVAMQVAPARPPWDAEVEAALESLQREICAEANIAPETLTGHADLVQVLKGDVMRLERAFEQHILSRPRFSLAGRYLLSCSNIDEIGRQLARLGTAPGSTARDANTNASVPVRRATAPDQTTRFVLEEVPLVIDGPWQPPQRLLIVGPRGDDHDRLVEACRDVGVKTVSLCLEGTRWVLPGGGSVPLEDFGALAKQLSEPSWGVATSDVLFVAQGSTQPDPSRRDLLLDLNAVAPFCLAKALLGLGWARSADGQRCWSSLIFAEDGPVPHAAAGIARCVPHEWPRDRVRARVLVVSEPRGALTAQRLLEGLWQAPQYRDVRLSGTGLVRPVMVERALSSAETGPAGLNADSVVLLTGGGTGITAEIACMLAKRYQATIVALGRTQFDGPSPRKPEEVAHGRRRAIAATAARVAAAGGRFEYLNVDVTRQRDVDRAVADIKKRHGRIDALVHGAGIIEDSIIARKPIAVFRRVVATKALSAQHLFHALRDEPLRFAVFLSSIVAQTGRAGQTDYCAGNEVLNQLAEHWRRTASFPVISTLWSVWSETGLAGPGVHATLKANGLRGIANEEGLNFLHDEIAEPGAPPWVLVTSEDTLAFASNGYDCGLAFPRQEQVA